MNNKTTITPRLYTVKQIAAYLNFPASSVYALVNKNEIPFKRIGNKSIRFDISEIDGWIDGQYNRRYSRQ